MTEQDAPLVRIAEIGVDPSRLDDYTALLREEIEASLDREPDVLMLYALALRDDPSQLRIVEVYASRPAYEAHLTTPHFLKYKTGTAAMVTSLKLIETDPVILRARSAL